MTWRPEVSVELTCDEVRDLLPVHALAMLEAPEASAVEAHLPLCPACQAIAGQFEAVTAALPYALEPVAPDPATRAQLLARLEAPEPVSLPAKRTTRRAAWTVLAAAAALMLAIVGGLWINQLIADRDEARATAALLREFVSPGSAAMALEPMSASEYEWGWGTGRLLKTSAGEMMLVVDGCPPTTDERHYPVWVAIGDDRTRIGEITIGEDGSGWMMVAFPDDVPEPEMLGVSMRQGDAPLVDLFLGDMT